MKPAVDDVSARQHSGGPSPVPGRGGNRNDRARKPGLSDVEAEIAGLLNQSTQELRLAWRKLHRTEPPFGISRDLLIRSLAYELQQRAHGSPNLALRRRLQTLAGASETGALSFEPGVVLKAGTTLVRQWRGRTHTILVCEDGFEYEGERYRSLTVIAERITGAHWSGPRFFGVTRRAASSRFLRRRGHDERCGQQDAARRNRPLRDLHAEILRGGARVGVQFVAGAARSL